MSWNLPHQMLLATPHTLGKTGAVIPLPLTTHGYCEVQPETQKIGREGVLKATPTEKVAHNFAIRALEKPGMLKPRPYVYICVRCRESFVVNQSRGAIVAVDRHGSPLPEPENSRQIATFGEGPCPGLRGFAQSDRQTTRLSQPPKFVRRLASIAAFIFGLPHPISSIRGRQIIPTAAITPHDLMQ